METPAALSTFTAEDLKTLLQRREPPCVSIYMPTHRRRTEGRSDAILFRNTCRTVEKVLQKDLPGAPAREIVERLKTYEREEFWEDGKSSDGLCVFVTQGFQAAFRLPGPFPELDVVGATFHTKPLIRYLQSNSLAYHLLSLNIHRVALFEGLGESIHEVALRGVPASLEEMEAGESQEAPRGQRSAGGDRIRYGQGGPKESAKADLERFFRVVAKEVWKNHLRHSTKPLLLAAPAQHQALFRKVAQIPTLLAEGVVVDPAKLGPEDLRAEARRALDPEIRSRIQKAKDDYGLARSRGHGSDSLSEIAGLLITGRVKTLFVESGRRIWGMLNPVTGQILPGDVARNAYDVDLLDELAELALVRGAEVFVLGKEDMPAGTGLAAVLRY